MTERLTLPRLARRWRRLGVIVYGASALLWLQLEDNGALAVSLFGAALALLLALLWLSDHAGGTTHTAHLVLVGALLLGAVIGLGAALATAVLMLLKTGLHSHLFPDYPPGMILATLERAPVWMLAGALSGAGVVLAWLALRPSPSKSS